MILTITPNAYIERTFVTEDLVLGSQLQADQSVVMPAGTGVSVSLVLRELGAETLTAGLVAGFSGDYFLDLLDHMAMPHQFVRCNGETPTAFHLVEFDQRRETNAIDTTMFGLPDHADSLGKVIEKHAVGTSSVILGGSLPSGIPLDTFQKYIQECRQQRLFTVLQASGRGMVQGVEGNAHLLRISRVDLGAMHPLFQDLTEAAAPLAGKLEKRLGEWATDAIMVMLASNRAVAVTTEGSFEALAEDVPFVNRSGVEEAFTAGVTLSYMQGSTWADSLKLGMAAASATVLQVGKAVCSKRDVQAIEPTVEVKPL